MDFVALFAAATPTQRSSALPHLLSLCSPADKLTLYDLLIAKGSAGIDFISLLPFDIMLVVVAWVGCQSLGRMQSVRRKTRPGVLWRLRMADQLRETIGSNRYQ